VDPEALCYGSPGQGGLRSLKHLELNAAGMFCSAVRMPVVVLLCGRCIAPKAASNPDADACLLDTEAMHAFGLFLLPCRHYMYC
jgi:hypothetical protein